MIGRSFLKPALAAFTAVAFVFLIATAAHAEQIIRHFDSRVFITKDGRLDVSETIVMDFGDEMRHGIRRTIPVKYQTKRGTYKTPTRVTAVTADGAAATYSQSTEFNNLIIKIGDGDRLITGKHTYKIHYLVARAINFFDNQPEVYWNATGNETPFPIERATAEFILPAGVSASDVKAKCFRGSQGSREEGTFSIGDNQVSFQTSDLAAMQGLTFVLRLPKGSVTIDDTSELMWWLMDWWPALFTPWLVLALVLTNWWVNGRDPANAYLAGVGWNPPKELSPAEVGTLIDESCDMADIVSTLVDLASRGYLKIKQLKTNVFFFSNTDYQFTKTDPPANATALKPFEQTFLIGVFATGQSVRLSDLKYNFYSYLPSLRNQIYSSLTDNHYFVTDPEKCRLLYQTIGTVVMFVGVASFFLSAAWAVGVGISGLIILLSSSAMPARTTKGVDACRQAVGFKRFVQKAEKDRIRVLAKDDPTIFGRLLPYAMVLGAADQWANSFHDLLTQPPDWYEPSDWGTPNFTFSSTNFVNDLGDGMRTCASTFVSTPPAPTSASDGAAGGFSGFDGGGGGFGGGGFS
ncbi:MAG TPA: DUF2207 domain-containing protein, partial [Candidatus Obscuribacterales bacterium]